MTTTSCDECVGLYDFVGVTGYVYGVATAEANVPLTTFYNSDLTDNILLAGSTQPPPGYGFVRIEVRMLSCFFRKEVTGRTLALYWQLILFLMLMTTGIRQCADRIKSHSLEPGTR